MMAAFTANLTPAYAQGESIQNDKTMTTPALTEALRLIAKAIQDPNVTVLVGQMRLDDSFRHTEGPASMSAQLDQALMSLQLHRVYVKQVIDSAESVPPIIYVQAGARSKPNTYNPDMIADDSLRLFFLKKPAALPQRPLVMNNAGFEITGKIAERIGTYAPTDLFQSLGLGAWLNQHSWFELLEGRGAVRVEGEGIALPPIAKASSAVTEALRLQQERKRNGIFSEGIRILTLPEKFTGDVSQLTKHVRAKLPGHSASKGDTARSGLLTKAESAEIILATEQGRSLLGKLSDQGTEKR